MKRNEAEDMLTKYGAKIHEKNYKGKFISGVILVPLGNHQIQDIMYALMNYQSTDLILSNYSEFDVAVIFDYPLYLETGFLDFSPLVLLLPEILEAK